VARTFTGPQDGELAEHMAACNARGPLAAHIAKLIPKADCSGFDALARVFSGTVKPGDRVRVLGEVPGPPWQCHRGLLCTA
jgi:U5 small nuclear ribonucleoprotein component